jgi:hypothetical protein
MQLQGAGGSGGAAAQQSRYAPGPRSDGVLPLCYSNVLEDRTTQPVGIPDPFPNQPLSKTNHTHVLSPSAGPVAAAVAAGRASLASSAALLGVQAVHMPPPSSSTREPGSYSGTGSMPGGPGQGLQVQPATAVQSAPVLPVLPAPGVVHKVLPQQGQGAIGRLVGALKGVLPGAGVVLAHPAGKRRVPVATGWGVLPGSATPGP